MAQVLGHVRDFYQRFEKQISSFALIGGFLFDALTIRRADTLWENAWVVTHLFIVAVCIVLINLEEHKGTDLPGSESKTHFWLLNILQFSFGGLMSTFLILYFRSATLLVSWPFILILAAAFIANERSKRHYTRLVLQISLFFLSLFTFAIFVIPVLIHRIGPPIFILSGLVSLSILWLFLAFLKKYTHERFYKSRKLLWLSIFGVYAGMNLLYFTNIIPPIPLSLKDSGVYHTINKDAFGDYLVGYEDHGWRGMFKVYEDIHVRYGDPIYAYSAVFSPARLNTVIVHNWQHYNNTTNRWEDEGNVTIPITGGRDEGYRTYSEKRYLTKGRWRVNVQTPEGQVIGRILFNVVPTQERAKIFTAIKN